MVPEPFDRLRNHLSKGSMSATLISFGTAVATFRVPLRSFLRFAPERLRRPAHRLYVVSPVKIKKQERSFGNLPTLIFLDNEHVHPVRSMDSPKFFLSNVGHNTLFLKVANSDVKDN